MHPFFIRCIDFIFPPSNDALVVRKLLANDVLLLYREMSVDGTTALTSYTDPSIRALIHETKFHGNGHAHTLLNMLLQKFLNETKRTFDVVTPIPLSRARMRARGYNQVTKVLTAQPLPPSITVNTKILVRTRDTRPQTELKRSERLTNLHDAFGVVKGNRIAGKHILLVDDVTTTGTTLKTAKAALLPFKPASITCLALAH